MPNRLTKNNRSKKFCKSFAWVFIILTLFSYKNTHAQLLTEQVYDDAATGMLIQANNPNLELDKAKWFNQVFNPTNQALVYLDPDNANSIVTTGANLVVNYSNNTAPNFIIGGYSLGAATVEDNYVSIISVNSAGNVYGGLSHYTQETQDKTDPNEDSYTFINIANAYTPAANNNHVYIGDNAGTINGSIFGGMSVISLTTGKATANDTSNSVSVASAYVTIPSAQINADNNDITIGNGISVNGDVMGGNASLQITTGGADANSATLYTTYADANANAKNSQINANGNDVTIGNGSNVGGDISGGNAFLQITTGKADARLSPNANANTNIKTLGSHINADSNHVTIGNGSSVGGNIMGGNASLSIAAGDIDVYASSTPGYNTANVDVSSNTLSASGNEVNFDGSLAGSSTAIYGGKITFDVQTGEQFINGSFTGNGNFLNAGSSATATGNKVIIGEHATFTPSSSLYGGYIEFNAVTGFTTENYDVFTGNTLNYAANSRASFDTIANFENYNFTLTPSLANSKTALISANKIVLGTDSTNISNGSDIKSKISVIGIHSGNILKADDQFILMESTNSFTGSGATGQTSRDISQVQQGISLLYDVRTDVDTTNNKVTATILSCNSGADCVSTTAKVNPQLKALSEGFLFNNQLVTRGADILAYDTYKTIKQKNKDNGFAPFILTSAQHNRYNSGSHIKSNDYFLMGGVSYQQDNITAAAIIEGGWGSYDSYNSFYNAANVHGNGNSKYYGVGTLGRYDFNNSIYMDGSLRYGRTHVKFDTNDIKNLATGANAKYKLDTNYASAHVGTGYIATLNEKNKMDLSIKYLWTTTQGKNVKVADDNIHFDRVNSSRIRANSELNHSYNKNLTLYTSLGYEFEFDGKAKAKTYDLYTIDAPSLRGGTGILTIGATLKPDEQKHLSFDINAQGYTGKREGIGVNFLINYAF